MFYFALYVGKAEGFRKADTNVTDFRSHGSQNKTMRGCQKPTTSTEIRGTDKCVNQIIINIHRYRYKCTN